jgi:hypothetical protein
MQEDQEKTLLEKNSKIISARIPLGLYDEILTESVALHLNKNDYLLRIIMARNKSGIQKKELLRYLAAEEQRWRKGDSPDLDFLFQLIFDYLKN